MAETYTLLGGTATAFAAVAFMFQSRHHFINEHERKLTEECLNLIKELNKNPKNSNEINLYLQNRKAELVIIRKRYDAALLAFGCLMAQIIIFISYIVFISIYGGTTTINPTLRLILITPGLLAFWFHICGDLIPAYKSQKKFRELFSLPEAETEDITKNDAN